MGTGTYMYMFEQHCFRHVCNLHANLYFLYLFQTRHYIQVQKLYRQGNYNGAVKASRQAQSWGMAAVIFGLCIFVLPIIMRLYFLHTHHYTHVHYSSPYYDY